MVQARMGQHGQAAGLMDQGHGVGGGDFEFGHPGGPAFLEEAFKGLVQAGAKAFLDQGPADMRAARGVAIGQGEDGFGAQGDAQIVDARRPFPGCASGGRIGTS